MKKRLYIIFIIATLFSFSCAHTDEQQKDTRITEEEAVKIAQDELVRRGQDLTYLKENRELTVLYNILPIEHFAPQLKDYIASSDYFKNEYRKLEGRNYWAVIYHVTDVRAKGGGVIVYIDADTGEVIEYERGY